MSRAHVSLFSVMAVSAAIAGCSSGNSPSTKDASVDDASVPDLSTLATSTIAQARMSNVTTPITVVAVVTGLHGAPGDYSQWYIEDQAGGPSSGVAVYCDPDKAACPTIRAPALGSLVAITGSLSTYKGGVQLVPTAQQVVEASVAMPPVATVTAADVAPGGSSPYRGVVVKYVAKLTVDSVTPAALYDTQCDTGASTDAGMPLCSDDCSPPSYSGFRANDGAGNEVYIEDFFFYTDHLQSSPECLGQPGVVPVTVGKTFSSVQGILDFDPYAQAQQLSPLDDSDYVTP